jgi:hypothetical protein
MPSRELSNQWQIGGASSFVLTPPSRRLARAGDRKPQNRSSRFLSRDAIPAVDEGDYCIPDFFICVEEAVVDAQLATAVAHHNGAIGRKSHTILCAQSETLESSAKLVGVPRGRLIQLERELIAITQVPHTPIV